MPKVLEHPTRLVRFASFELDSTSGDLRRGENTVRLQPQPLKLLLALLRRPGEVVTRDELKQELMPDAAYGDFDHAINLAVSKLRAALNDSSDSPQLIETLPKRGYRFVGRVESPDSDGPATESGGRSPRSWLKRKLTWGLVALTLLAGGLAAVAYVHHRNAQKLTEKDTIILADFENKTGDPIFDDTLKTGLTIALNQSPFLNVLPDSKVADTLKLMTLPVTTRLSYDVAREVCVRAGSKVVVAGSIANVGSEYLLTLKAFHCATGQTMFQEQAEVQQKEEVLKTLGKQAAVLRLALGESLATVREFDIPMDQATTPSIEALQAYTLGRRQYLALDFSGAVSLFQRAVEIDPNFAMAYLRLAVVLQMYGDDAKSREAWERAFSLRDRTSEREKLTIEANYYLSIGDLDNGRRVAELRKSLYPQDAGPYETLSRIYDSQGQYDDAYFAARECLNRGPNQQARRNLAYEAIQTNRFDEAQKVLAEAEAAQRAGEPSWDGMMTAYYAYKMAFLQHDTAAMNKIVESIPGDAKLQHWVLFDRSQTEAYFGRVGKARELNQHAIGVALDLKRMSDAALYGMVPQALWEANFGNFTEARRLANQALVTDEEKSVKAAAALTLARTGDFERAVQLADELVTQNPSDTLIKRRTVPMILANVAIGQNRPELAVELLRDAEPIELGDPQVIYTRGQALLAMHSGAGAAAEFQKLIDHPNVLIEDPLGSLAHLGKARAYVLSGDRQNARAEYETFLGLWKDADADVPIYQQAKAEYAKLPR